MNSDIQIVLCQTSHPGNIGAVARAMKNMGLSQLVLVSPKQFPHPEALALASGADDILSEAKIVPTLIDAIGDRHFIYGTSARSRAFEWPQLTPRAAAAQIREQSHHKISIVFGSEQSGLSNEDLQQCDYHIAIPTSPIYSSLNLAQAVLILCYEIYLTQSDKVPVPVSSDKATAKEISDLLNHIQAMAISSGFLDPDSPKKFIPRMQRLFAKSQLEKEEVAILRGLLKAFEKSV